MEALRGILHVRFETRPHAASVEGMQRQEIWEYPLEALREAIINALVHRDYTVPGDIQSRVGEDTLEVWSPGLLPEGVSIADIEREGHVSRPRNPALAQMFYFAGLIGRWGVGTTLIQRACRMHDLPAPVFQEDMGGFQVSLSQNPYTPERLRGLGLSDRHLSIVRHLKEHGTITNSEVQRLTGVSKATATRDLDYLVTHGMLVLQGRTGRGSRYILKGS